MRQGSLPPFGIEEAVAVNRGPSTADVWPGAGRDAIGQFTCAADATLDRLQGVLERQHRFAAHAAHELRTPLAALRLQLEEALLYGDDTDLETALAGALRSLERLEKAVVDVLLAARLDTSDSALMPTAAYLASGRVPG